MHCADSDYLAHLAHLAQVKSYHSHLSLDIPIALTRRVATSYHPRMLPVGTVAPNFTLEDQFGQPFTLSNFLNKQNVLLLFYPRDWTPTCSIEVPTLEALANQFASRSDTQVAAVSVDSRYSHGAWGASLGGVSIPILADSSPPGAVSKMYDVWLPDKYICDRATVVIDKSGLIRFSASVGVDGKRNVAGFLDMMKRMNGQPASPAQGARSARGPIGEPMTLFATNSCGFCKQVVATIANLRCQPYVHVRYVDTDPAARAALAGVMGNPSVPLLLVGNQYLVGADRITNFLMSQCSSAQAA
jgi:peroxiredoxin/glutaredoxin-related protein